MTTDLLAAAAAAPGFMPPEEGRALYEAARAVAVRGPLLEVGSWMGKSALYLAAAARGPVRSSPRGRPRCVGCTCTSSRSAPS